MNINAVILTVGRLKEKYYAAAAAEYVKRLGVFGRLQIVELPSGKNGPQAVSEESARIENYLSRQNPSVQIRLLDAEGELPTSTELAEELRRDGGVWTFVIGGSYGFTDELKEKYPRLSLSRLTLPHELARVVLLEQLYRCATIWRGKNYHH